MYFYLLGLRFFVECSHSYALHLTVGKNVDQDVLCSVLLKNVGQWQGIQNQYCYIYIYIYIYIYCCTPSKVLHKDYYY
jgi:hypothetical protein